MIRIDTLSATPSRQIDVRLVVTDLGRLDLSNLYKLRDQGGDKGGRYIVEQKPNRPALINAYAVPRAVTIRIDRGIGNGRFGSLPAVDYTSR